MDEALDKNPNKIVLKDDEPEKENQVIEQKDPIEPKNKQVESSKKEDDKKPENSDELEKESEEELVEIDGEQYTIDKDGNAVKDGKVVYTKSQMDSMTSTEDHNEPDENVASIDDIAAKSGIVLTDDAGEPIQYDMTIEGLARREMDVYNKGVRDASSNAVDEFLKNNPDILDVVNYKLTYGTIDGYTSNFDYSKINLDKSNKAQLKEIIVKAEMAKGNSVERANRIANLIEADNTLETEAEDALNYLKGKQDQQREANIKAMQEEQARIIEEQNRFYGIGLDAKGNAVDLNIEGSIYDLVVKKGSVRGLDIPKNGIVVKTDKGDKLISRTDLYNYISVPVRQIDGVWYTQAQLDDMARMNNPEEMILNYIRNLTGDDISQLVAKEINKSKVVNIRKLVSKGPRSNGSRRSGSHKDGEDKIILPIK